MIKPTRRTNRMKLGQCEPFEQALWRSDDSPHLIVDTRKTPDPFRDVAWSPNNQLIAASTTGGIKVWTLSPTAELRTFKIDSTAVSNVFSPDSKLLAGGSLDGRLTIWDLSSGRCLWSKLAHAKGVARIRFDLQAAKIVSVGTDGNVKVWSVSDGTLLQEVTAPERATRGFALSADARLAALGNDGGLTFIDLRSGAEQRGEISADVRVNSLVFGSGGTLLASGDSDGIVRLWSLETAKEIRVVSRLFSGSTQKEESLKEPAPQPLSSGTTSENSIRTGPDFIRSLAFGRGDSLLAAGTTDGSVAVWKVDDDSLMDPITAHTCFVSRIAFSDDGRMLATCGGLDRIVKLWSVGRRIEELVTLIALGDEQWAALTPDDRFDSSSGGLEYLHWASGARVVPAKEMLNLHPDPTLLPSLHTAGRRIHKSRPRPIDPGESPAQDTLTDAGSQTPVLTVRTRPSHQVSSVAWSEDDSILAGGTEDGNIDLWDRATGLELRILRGHSDSITSLAFVGPNTLASGARDGTVRLWNILTGELLQTFPIGLTSKMGGVSITWSPTSGLLLCAGYDGTIRWLHLGMRTCLHTERVLWEQNGKTSLLIEKVVVSPDGSIVIRPYDRDSVAVFNLPANQLLYEFKSNNTPGAIAFERDGSRFALGPAPYRRTIIVGGGKDAHDPDYKPQNCAVDERLTKDGTIVEPHLGHRGDVVALAFSPDGASLATGSEDGTASIWRKGGGDERLKLETGSDAVRAVSYNQDGSLLATGESNGPFKGQISVWNTTSGKREQTFDRHIGDVHPVRFSPDGSLLAAAGEDGILRLWRLRTRIPPALIKGHTGRIFSLAFSPDGQYIATASWDGTSRLWRTDSGEFIRMFDNRENVKVWSVAFNPDGLTLATGCEDGSARVWNISSGDLLFTIEDPVPARERAVLALGYSPDGKQLATGSLKQRILLWNTETAEARMVLKHEAGVFSLAFNSSGTTLVSGDIDQDIYLWDVATGVKGQCLKGHVKPGHVEKGTSVQFTPDGKVIASGGTDGTLRLWDTATGSQLALIQGHAGPIASVAFDPNGTVLAAGSNDASASLWDIRDHTSPQRICNLYSFPDDTWAVVDSRGRFDAANGGDIPWLHWVIGLETVALSQLKERYFEPNLLPKLMGTDSEPLRDVPSLTSVELHPDVEMLKLDATKKKASIRLTNRGGGIGRVVVSINGKEVEADARDPEFDPNGPVQDLLIDVTNHAFLKPGNNDCEVRAYNAAGYLVGRQLRWVCQGPRKPAEAPRLWAIISGISDYQGDTLDLRFAAKDASDVADAVRIGAAQLFGADRVHLTLLVAPHSPVKNEHGQPEVHQGQLAAEQLWPTRQNLMRAFAEAKAAKSTDILLVYMATRRQLW